MHLVVRLHCDHTLHENVCTQNAYMQNVYLLRNKLAIFILFKWPPTTEVMRIMYKNPISVNFFVLPTT